MKFQKILLFILILALPTQIAKHFWPEFSFVYGVRVDYLSPTVYVSDLIIFLLLSFWLARNYKEKNGSLFKKTERKKWLIYSIFFLLFIYLLITSLLVAQNQGAAIFKLLKFLELFFLGLYVYKNVSAEEIGLPLSISTLVVSLIAWLQFLYGRSIDFFWFLGERSFNTQTPGIALSFFWGKTFLRPYSIFSHPNSLSGFILVSLLLLLFCNVDKRVFYLTFLAGVSVIFITFSFSSWVAAMSVLLSLFFLKKKSRQFSFYLFFLFIILFVSSFVILPNLPLSNSEQQRVYLRKIMAEEAIEMLAKKPLFGFGLNNYIPASVGLYGSRFSNIWLLQPVHNIYLLLFCETGLIGFSLVLFLFLKLINKITNIYLFLALISILIIGFFDHYWLTIQQNLLLLSLVFGFSAKGFYRRNKLEV